MFHVNDALYFWVVDPIATIYEQVVPKPARIGVGNFFNNITTPVRLVNCLLQGKNEAAGREFDRFLINSTAGVLGFGDPAQDQHDLKPADEDLGQTLAVHGVGDGFYLVLPLLGPSTARDSAGFVGDLFLRPFFYLESCEAKVALSATEYVNKSSFHIGQYEAFKSAAVDPYVAMRQTYIQYRRKKIQE